MKVILKIILLRGSILHQIGNYQGIDIKTFKISLRQRLHMQVILI